MKYTRRAQTAAWKTSSKLIRQEREVHSLWLVVQAFGGNRNSAYALFWLVDRQHKYLQLRVAESVLGRAGRHMRASRIEGESARKGV